MAITAVSVENFRSFNKLAVELGRFTVLVGSNASGKTNFVQIFKFIRDLVMYGLPNAVSMQGGPEYMTNINMGPTTPFRITVVTDSTFRFPLGGGRVALAFSVSRTHYALTLRFTRKKRVEIVEDRVILQGKLRRFPLHGARHVAESRPSDAGDDAEVTISSRRGRLEFNAALPQGVALSKDDIFPRFFRHTGVEVDRNAVLITGSAFYLPIPHNLFGDIALYDFDPRLPKKAVPITGRSELEEDGSNLAIILKRVIESSEQRRRFNNLMKDLLPFVDRIDVQKFADRSLLFKLREIYSKKTYLPASLLSDGTINVSALLIALYFEARGTTIIEEPERNVHPSLISRIVEMMKDAAREKQIMVTTHNPEVVKHGGLENLLLITRDPKTGWSEIARPKDSVHVNAFLRSDIGLDELFVKDLLKQ